MNHFRLRLIIGAACVSATVTVLLLHGAGLLRSASRPEAVPLYASRHPPIPEISPYRVDCSEPLAKIRQPDADALPLHLVDTRNRMIRCASPPLH